MRTRIDAEQTTVPSLRAAASRACRPAKSRRPASVSHATSPMPGGGAVQFNHSSLCSTQFVTGMAVHLDWAPPSVRLVAWGRAPDGWHACITWNQRVSTADGDDEIGFAAWVPASAVSKPGLVLGGRAAPDPAPA